MTPELSNAITCATALRAQLQSDIATPSTPETAALSHAIDHFLTRAFRGDNTTWEQRYNEMVATYNILDAQAEGLQTYIDNLHRLSRITPPLKNRSGTFTSHSTTQVDAEFTKLITPKTASPFLEWDAEWSGNVGPEKRGYMAGDRSITLFIINREIHDSSCRLQGAFIPDVDEITPRTYLDEAAAKSHAEELTHAWLQRFTTTTP